ncbi:hypothetical protein LSTR_LSTR016647 [Laodelphax striatellus]|uniref:Uncharacterized protein n=1 Tax=Laodelphax striatellus TaxID=195883 RepID=A0A482WE04_LAOST|nr:hypothetical protein LSTR_LSTR016647 [Laodelphax striatellus]
MRKSESEYVGDSSQLLWCRCDVVCRPGRPVPTGTGKVVLFSIASACTPLCRKKVEEVKKKMKREEEKNYREREKEEEERKRKKMKRVKKKNYREREKKKKRERKKN